MKCVYFDKNTGLVLQWMDPDLQNFEMPAADSLLDVNDEQWVMQEAECWVVGTTLTNQPRPSLQHDWDDLKSTWVLNQARQDALEDAEEQARIDLFQTQLDEKMSWATDVAAPLDYANKRKALPKDKAARLAAFNAYIDALAALEYSAAVVWPVEPT